MEKYLEYYDSLEKIFLEVFNNPKKDVQCPASWTEIESIENKFNVKFPLAYKAWLLKFGHSNMGGDGFYSLARFKTACQEAEMSHLLEEINQYFTCLNFSYIFIDYIVGSDAYALLSLDEENPLVYSYLGHNALAPMHHFTEGIRAYLLGILIEIANRFDEKSDRIRKKFPFLKVYLSSNPPYRERGEFISAYTYLKVDKDGKFLGFEEVEMAFYKSYVSKKNLHPRT